MRGRKGDEELGRGGGRGDKGRGGIGEKGREELGREGGQMTLK